MAPILSVAEREYLEKIYFSAELPGSLRGPRKLLELVKAENKFGSLTLKQISTWLRSQPVYSRFRGARVNYPRNSGFNPQFVGDLCQFDLMDMSEEEEYSELTELTYKHVMVMVDCFSRYGMIIALANRESGTIIEALKRLFDTHNYHPERAMCDNAGEFVAAPTKKYFKEEKIHMSFSTSKIHCPTAERLIRTLKQALRRHRSAYNTNAWIEPLGAIMLSYNKSKSLNTHKLRPADVFSKPKVAWKAYANLYLKKKTEKKKNKTRESDVKKASMKRKYKRREFSASTLPKVGEYCRISRLKDFYEKESSERGQFSHEVYKIVAVTWTNGLPMMTLEDLKGKKIKGKFYVQELIIVDYSPTRDVFEVEEILGDKIDGGVKMVRVKWRGYNRKFAEWIRESALISLRPGEMKAHIQ